MDALNFGTRRSRPTPEPTGDIKLAARNTSELHEIINRASLDRSNRYTAMLEDGDYPEAKLQRIGFPFEVYGAGSELGVVFTESNSKKPALHVHSSSSLRMINFKVDARLSNIWSLVIGKAYPTHDGGPVANSFFSHFEVAHATQECVRVAASSVDLTFHEAHVHDSGSSGEWGELIYIGQGGDQTDRPSNIVWSGLHAHGSNNGEGFDVKAACSYITLEDFYIHDIRAPYGGAVTLGYDDVWPHRLDEKHMVRRGFIEDVGRSGRWSVQGIQTGSNVKIQDVAGRGIDGKLVQVKDRFARSKSQTEVSLSNVMGLDGLEKPSGVNVVGDVANRELSLDEWTRLLYGSSEPALPAPPVIMPPPVVIPPEVELPTPRLVITKSGGAYIQQGNEYFTVNGERTTIG